MRKGLLYCVTAGLLTLLMCLSVRAEGTALTVSLPLRQHVTNGLPVRVLYTLTADTPDAPMPEGSSNGVFRMLLQNEQDTALPPITYTAPGVWTYTLRAETAGGTLSPERLRIQVEIVETAGELLPLSARERRQTQHDPVGLQPRFRYLPGEQCLRYGERLD